MPVNQSARRREARDSLVVRSSVKAPSGSEREADFIRLLSDGSVFQAEKRTFGWDTPKRFRVKRGVPPSPLLQLPLAVRRHWQGVFTHRKVVRQRL